MSTNGEFREDIEVTLYKRVIDKMNKIMRIKKLQIRYQISKVKWETKSM